MATSNRGKVLTQKQFHLFEADFAAIDEVSAPLCVNPCEFVVISESHWRNRPM